MGQQIDLTTQVQGILPPANGGAGGNAGLLFADAEVPSGAINGSNGTFSLAQIPNPAASLMLFVNRLLQIQGTDYTLVGNVITIAAPPSGSTVISWYRYVSSPSALLLRDSLSLSDAIVFDVPAAVIPLGLLDSLPMADRMTMVFSSAGLLVITDFLVMADAIRLSLIPLTQQPAETLTLSDAAVIVLSLNTARSDNMANWLDRFVYFYNSPNGVADLYIPQDVLTFSDATVVVLSAQKTFAEQMTQSDAFVIQMR